MFLSLSLSPVSSFHSLPYILILKKEKRDIHPDSLRWGLSLHSPPFLTLSCRCPGCSPCSWACCVLPRSWQRGAQGRPLGGIGALCPPERSFQGSSVSTQRSLPRLSPSPAPHPLTLNLLSLEKKPPDAWAPNQFTLGSSASGQPTLTPEAHWCSLSLSFYILGVFSALILLKISILLSSPWTLHEIVPCVVSGLIILQYKHFQKERLGLNMITTLGEGGGCGWCATSLHWA